MKETVKMSRAVRQPEKRYRRKAELLNKKYEPFIKEFRQHKDDRLLAVNMLDQLTRACKAMESMDDAFVRAAFNHAFIGQNEMMENIVTRFTGKVWNGYAWIEGAEK